MQTLLDTFQPQLLEIIGVILTAIIALVANRFRALTGLAIEEKHRAALHAAIMSGVEAALADGRGAGLDMIRDKALAHARASVPDAIRRLAPGDGVLERIAARYARQALTRFGG